MSKRVRWNGQKWSYRLLIHEQVLIYARYLDGKTPELEWFSLNKH